MAELTASMARRTITATILDMYEGHTGGRTFKWHLDGVLVHSESVMSTDTSRTYTFNGVSYLAQHTVYLVVNNYEDTECFDTFTATVADTMALWSWNASNGTATAEQTQAAYTAIITRGRTKNFNYLVWNDLVERLAAAKTAWNPRYATIDDALMAASGSALTAERFNAVVQNIGNPWMFWAYQSDRKGYLGRLAVRGKAQYGVNRDKVYGAYLVELAKMLNVLIDAEGEFNAGYATRIDHINASGLYTSASLPLRAPASRHLNFDESLYLAYSLGLTAPASRHLERTGKLWTVPNLNFRADEAKHLAARIRVQLGRDLTLIATNERAIYADILIGVLTDILLSPASSGILGVTAGSGTTPNVTLTPIASAPLGVTIHFGPGADVTLTPSETTPFGVTIHFGPTPDVTLTPSETTALLATINELSRISAELSPSASGILEITAGHITASDILLSPDAAAQMLYSRTVGITNDLVLAALKASSMQIRDNVKSYWEYLDLTAPKSARMAYDSDTALNAVLDAVLRTPTAARMHHDVTLAFAAQFFAALSAPASAHMKYDATTGLTAVLDATMRAPTSANMVYTANNTMAAALSADLNALASVRMFHDALTSIQATLNATMHTPPSTWMAYSANNTISVVLDADLRNPTSARMTYWSANIFKSTLEAVLNDSTSVHMTVAAAEEIGLSDEHELSDTPSLGLEASEIQLASQMHDTELVPTDSLHLAADIADSLNDTADVDMSAAQVAVLEDGDSGSKTDSDSTMQPVPGSPMEGDFTEKSSGDHGLSADDSVSVVLIDFRAVSQFAAALITRPVEVPTSDWVTQDGTHLHIIGTYYNRLDDEDSSKLLIDNAYYVEPVQTGTHLSITSEGYNDYGMGVDDENPS